MGQRMTRDERVERDQLIYRLHLAGVSYRSIGKRVGMTPGGVHKIVRRELSQAAEVRDDLQGDAEIEHSERMRQLYAAYAPKAQAGDLRAAEFCRRVLADLARIQGLNQSVAERLIVGRDDDLDPADGDGEDDELEAWRKRREQPGYTGMQEMDGGAYDGDDDRAAGARGSA